MSSGYVISLPVSTKNELKAYPCLNSKYMLSICVSTKNELKERIGYRAEARVLNAYQQRMN